VNKIHVHIPYPKVGDYLARIKQERLNLEIYFPSSSLDTLKTGDIERLKDSLDYHPSLSMHAPFMDLSPGAVDSKVKAVTVERYTHMLDVAEVLSPEVIVFHSGYEKWKYAHRIDIWLESSLSTWRPLIERAALIGTKIAIENIFEDEPANLYLLMKELHSESFGICFDTGHYNLFSKVSLEEWLGSLSPYILELHLHDNDRSFDSHLSIGDGNFDFKTLFSRLKGKQCVYTVEAHTQESVLKSIERLEGYIG